MWTLGKQKPVTSDILDCFCGSKARVIDENYDEMYHVECFNGHRLSKRCGTFHRAVMLWNNRVNDRKNQRKLKMVIVEEFLIRVRDNEKRSSVDTYHLTNDENQFVFWSEDDRVAFEEMIEDAFRKCICEGIEVVGVCVKRS